MYKQPSSKVEIDASRAALSACPVAAIRVETTIPKNKSIQQQEQQEKTMRSHEEQQQRELASQMALSPKHNGLDLPFPRLLTDNVWFVGHHNEASFGAVPYLTVVGNDDDETWIMVDTPKYSKSAVETVTSLTGPDGPNYLLLTHVDDTADHGKWKERFPNLKRIFHSGDLGPHNWLGDKTLEDVEVLLKTPKESNEKDELVGFDLEGNVLHSNDNYRKNEAVVLHTPGHSPGSVTLYVPSRGVVFTGDTLGYTQRTKTLTGFPRYGNNLQTQKDTLEKLGHLEWEVVAPGHGHARDYTHYKNKGAKEKELDEAIQELQSYGARRY